jgi:2'-5' RNA ligase
LFLRQLARRLIVAGSQELAMQLALFDESEGRPPPQLPPRERDVLFYALLLGPQLFAPASRLVTALRERHGLTGRMKSSDTFHISVMGFRFADTLRDGDLELASRIGQAVPFVPFELAFGELLSWGKPKAADLAPLVMTCGDSAAPVVALAGRIGAAMIAHGTKPAALVPTLPHLTLLYDAVRVPPQPLEPPISITVQGFALVLSHRGQSRYSVLWRSGPDQPGNIPPTRPQTAPAVTATSDMFA